MGWIPQVYQCDLFTFIVQGCLIWNLKNLDYLSTMETWLAHMGKPSSNLTENKPKYAQCVLNLRCHRYNPT